MPVVGGTERQSGREPLSAPLISIHRHQIGSIFPNCEREVTCRIHDWIAGSICATHPDRAEQTMSLEVNELVTAIGTWMPDQMGELID